MSIKEKAVRLSPILKYPGGKEKELKYILPNMPKSCKNYYEPFIGGGAVYFSLDSEGYFINDKSSELISLYQMIKTKNIVFLEKMKAIEDGWAKADPMIEKHMGELTECYLLFKKDKLDLLQLNHWIFTFVDRNAGEFQGLLREHLNIALDNFQKEIKDSLQNKFTRMKKLEAKKGDLTPEDRELNLIGAFKNAFYIHFRYLYNHVEELGIEVPFATAIYYFVREFCYASMFRYNRQGKFNVPYGGISYNQKSMAKKIQCFSSEELIFQLNNTTIENTDFEDFFRLHEPQKEDFIFLDPPYDTEFSTYARNEFGREDQRRLANFLLHQCKARFMLIIKNTEYIRSLYPPGEKTANKDKVYIGKFDKKYVVSFQDRNDKDVEHLMITNYPI